MAAERGVQAWVQRTQRVPDRGRVGHVLARGHHPHRIESLDDHFVVVHVGLLQLLQSRFHSRQTLGFGGDAIVRLGAAQEQDPAQLLDRDVVAQQLRDLAERDPEIAKREDPVQSAPAARARTSGSRCRDRPTSGAGARRRRSDATSVPTPARGGRRCRSDTRTPSNHVTRRKSQGSLRSAALMPVSRRRRWCASGSSGLGGGVAGGWFVGFVGAVGVAGEAPAAFVTQGVVAATQQTQVLFVGEAVVFPPDEVMGVAPGGRTVTAGETQPRSRIANALCCAAEARRVERPRSRTSDSPRINTRVTEQSHARRNAVASGMGPKPSSSQRT